MTDTTPARRNSSTPAARHEARSEELRRLLHVVSPTADVELTARKRCEEEGIDDIRQLRQLYDRGISLSDKLPLGVALELSHLFEEKRADDDLDCDGMVSLLHEMAGAARERDRRAAEAKRLAEDAAREAAEAAEAERRKLEDAERERVRQIESQPVAYSGFSWGSSFDDPQLSSGIEDALDAPRIVELDDD